MNDKSKMLSIMHKCTHMYVPQKYTVETGYICHEPCSSHKKEVEEHILAGSDYETIKKCVLNMNPEDLDTLSADDIQHMNIIFHNVRLNFQ